MHKNSRFSDRILIAFWKKKPECKLHSIAELAARRPGLSDRILARRYDINAEKNDKAWEYKEGFCVLHVRTYDRRDGDYAKEINGKVSLSNKTFSHLLLIVGHCLKFILLNTRAVSNDCMFHRRSA